MIFNKLRRFSIPLVSVLCLALGCPAQPALARGGGSRGLSWGYHNRAQQGVWWGLFSVTNPWAAMGGWGIPHRSLDAPDLNQGTPRPWNGSSGGGGQSFPQVDRQTMFPGSSSQSSMTSQWLASRAGVRLPTSGGPFRTDSQFQPPYFASYNSYWHHGYWGGGRWGWTRWVPDLGSAGFPRWGLGAWYFASGYGNYVNPFLDGNDTSPIDLSRPIAVGTDPPSDPSTATASNADPNSTPTLEEVRSELIRSPEVTAGLRSLDAARAAFREKNFTQALDHCDEAIRTLPRDPALQEFRALVLFAKGDYRAAAASAYAVLSVSPGCDWTTLSGHYTDSNEYTRQLRELENFRKQHPEDAAPAFLLAYHYTACRHTEIAVRHLNNVARLLPNDELAPHLATLLSGASEKEEIPASADGPVPAKVSPPGGNEPPPIDPARLVGTWRASRGPGHQIELQLAASQRFTWVITAGNQPRMFAGSYTVDENQLLLSVGPATVIGVVTARPGGGFNFRLLENAPVGAGLDFGK